MYLALFDRGMEQLERFGLLDDLSPEISAYYRGKVSEY